MGHATLRRLSDEAFASAQENLERARQAVVNYCDDVRVFAGCVTGRREWPTRPAARVRCGYLEQALAHAEIEITHIEEHELRPRVVCNVVHEEIHAPFRGFNRAQGAVIEAAILVSRLHILPADKVARELGYLSIALEKTAGPREREAWGWLMARIEAHLEEFAGAQ